jgi:NADH:ubiquinone oxidoreductase subunit 2 (subunit N)
MMRLSVLRVSSGGGSTRFHPGILDVVALWAVLLIVVSFVVVVVVVVVAVGTVPIHGWCRDVNGADAWQEHNAIRNDRKAR